VSRPTQSKAGQAARRAVLSPVAGQIWPTRASRRTQARKRILVRRRIRVRKPAQVWSRIRVLSRTRVRRRTLVLDRVRVRGSIRIRGRTPVRHPARDRVRTPVRHPVWGRIRIRGVTRASSVSPDPRQISVLSTGRTTVSGTTVASGMTVASGTMVASGTAGALATTVDTAPTSVTGTTAGFARTSATGATAGFARKSVTAMTGATGTTVSGGPAPTRARITSPPSARTGMGVPISGAITGSRTPTSAEWGAGPATTGSAARVRPSSTTPGRDWTVIAPSQSSGRGHSRRSRRVLDPGEMRTFAVIRLGTPVRDHRTCDPGLISRPSQTGGASPGPSGIRIATRREGTGITGAGTLIQTTPARSRVTVLRPATLPGGRQSTTGSTTSAFLTTRHRRRSVLT
jgi:hypothetical protein